MINAKPLKKDDNSSYKEIEMTWKDFFYGFEDHCSISLLKALKKEFDEDGYLLLNFGDLTDEEEKEYKLSGNNSVLKWRIISNHCKPTWDFIVYNVNSPFGLWLISSYYDYDSDDE